MARNGRTTPLRPSPLRELSLRTALAVLAARGLGAASRRLGRGGGTALPGLVAERIDPCVVGNLARGLGGGRIIVTGTNGKTTTSRMLAGMLTAAGRAPVHNRSGSNLMRGLAATLTAEAGLNGRISGRQGRAGVFEVDEATLPRAVAAIRPNAVVVGNLFRDQLDRYGEVDSIAALWRQAVARMASGRTLVLNADDPTVAALAGSFAGRTVYFGVEDRSHAGGSEHAADSRWCGRCGTEYSYDTAFFWHIGHWRCPGCGDCRPTPDVAAETVVESGGVTRIGLRTPSGRLSLDLPLSGLYNAYNALAAVAGSLALGVPLAAIERGLAGFTAAFGRQERLRVQGRDVEILLCKNPAGVNQVLRTILAGDAPLHLLLILNDGVQDGRDISWIWDVDFERLAGRTAVAVAGGTRAADMALRLKYAGIGVPGSWFRVPSGTGSLGTRNQEPGTFAVEAVIEAAVTRALGATPEGATLHVLPTYTAMLTVREYLAKLAGRQRFWQQ